MKVNSNKSNYNQNNTDYHIVKSGDSLSKIANKYLGDSSRYKEIFELNRNILKDENSVKVGMKLKLPTEKKVISKPEKNDFAYHTIQSGDTLQAISKKYYDTTRNYNDIKEVNGITDTRKLKIGQKIKIPKNISVKKYGSDSYQFKNNNKNGAISNIDIFKTEPVKVDNTRVVINYPINNAIEPLPASSNLDISFVESIHKKGTTKADEILNPRSSDEIALESLKDLKKHFRNGKLKGSKYGAYGNHINSILSNSSKRAALIEYFGLDNNQNKKDLLLASVLEGDDINRNIAGDKSKIYANVFAVGGAILNRAISTNITESMMNEHNNQDFSKGKTFTIKDIVTDSGEFQIRHKFNKKRPSYVNKSYDQFKSIHKDPINDLLNGKNRFLNVKRGSHLEENVSEMYFFQNKSISKVNTTYKPEFGTDNSHVFSEFANKNRYHFSWANSFHNNKSHIDWAR